MTGACSTINGLINVGSSSMVRDLKSINGNVRVANKTVVKGDISLINGNVHCDPGVKVTGDVETINGEIILEGTLVEDDLATYNGNIKLYGGTLINGSIHVKERHSSMPDYSSLYIEIDKSTVEGDIINQDNDTDVTVYLSNGGRIKGRVECVKIVER